MYNFRAEKEFNNPVHRQIEDYSITEDDGIIIYFTDGSHTYLEWNLIYNFIAEIYANRYQEE